MLNGKDMRKRVYRHMIDKAQQGATLIEILITVLVMSVGLVGMATLQFDAVKRNNDAFLRFEAVNLAYDMSDRIRLNREGAEDGDYVLAITANAPATVTTKAEGDIQEWLTALSASLPSGDGQITRAGDEFSITICWDEARDGLAIPLDGSDPCFTFVSGL